MRTYPIKIPKLLKSIFHEWIWAFNTTTKEVYLTFDDGPIPEITPWVVQLLAQYNAKATFFCIGDNIQKHPDVFKLLLDSHHKIGNHTFNHLKGWGCKPNKYIDNILKAEKFIPETSSKLFRPPYGKITLEQSKSLRTLGYKIVMWEILSADFDTKITTKKCTENVLKNIQNGSIIVFHDSKKAFPRLKETLPKVLAKLHKKGYQFKTIG